MSRTFNELGKGSPSLSGVGVVESVITIRQSDFGRPLAAVDLPRVGVVTPALGGTGRGHLIAGLQRLTSTQLVLEVLAWGAFLADLLPGIAVGVAPGEDTQISTPLRYAPFRIIEVLDKGFTAEVNASFAAMVAVAGRGSPCQPRHRVAPATACKQKLATTSIARVRPPDVLNAGTVWLPFPTF
jgi:hypothetical protein